MKKIIYLLALLWPFVEPCAKLLEVDYFVLENGLKVAVIENHKAPVCLQMLYYKTGSINDPKGKGGIAHLLEHLMFRGTKKVSGEEFNRLTDANGAENNAYTTYDETVYHELSDISKLELMMALEADRMNGLVVDEEDFLKEREVVLQERYQRFETQPTSLFYEMMNKMLWQDQPRANPVSGSADEIVALTKKDAVEFYRKWYRPDNALLVLSGDLTGQEARILAQKHYGKIKAEGKLAKAKKTDKPREMATLVKLKLKNVEQPRFVSYIRLEPGSLSKQDVAALGVLMEYLAGDDTSYLYEKLVYQDKKTLGVDMGLSYDDKLGGMVVFYTTPGDKKLSPEDILKLYEQETANGVQALDAQKVEKIKNQMLSDTVYLLENPESAAQFVGTMLMSDYSADEIMHYDEVLQAITLENVLEAWNKVMQSEVRLSGYLE